MLKWLSGNIVDEPGRVRALSFLGCTFCELEVLFLVGGVGSLVHFVINQVDGVETEIYLAVFVIIWVFFEQI